MKIERERKNFSDHSSIYTPGYQSSQGYNIKIEESWSNTDKPVSNLPPTSQMIFSKLLSGFSFFTCKIGKYTLGSLVFTWDNSCKTSMLFACNVSYRQKFSINGYSFMLLSLWLLWQSVAETLITNISAAPYPTHRNAIL